MTQATPPSDQGWTAPAAPAAPAAAPVAAARPGRVTAAAIILIVLGVLTLLLGLLLLLGTALFAGAAGGAAAEAELPGLGGMMGAFAGLILVFTIIVVGFGVLQLLSGIKSLSGRPWARITGIVVAAISGLFALTGLGSGDSGGPVLSVIMLVANAFVVFGLVTGGEWFAARTTTT